MSTGGGLQRFTGRLLLVAATPDHLRAELESPSKLGFLLHADVPGDWPPGEYDRNAQEFFRGRMEQAEPSALGWYVWYAVLLPPEEMRCWSAPEDFWGLQMLQEMWRSDTPCLSHGGGKACKRDGRRSRAPGTLRPPGQPPRGPHERTECSIALGSRAGTDSMLPAWDLNPGAFGTNCIALRQGWCTPDRRVTSRFRRRSNLLKYWRCNADIAG